VVGGELGFSAVKYFDDIEDFLSSNLDAGALGRLDIDATGGKVDAVLHLDLRATIPASDPWAALDEAYLRLGLLEFLDIEGGLRKVSWGRADSLSVLDIINPLNLTDLTVSDPMDQKMAQTMLRAVARLGDHATLDAIYLPFYEPNKIAFDGRWAPRQVRDLREQAHTELFDGLYKQYKATAFATAYTAAYSAAYPLAYAAALAAGAAATDAAATAASTANNQATTVATDTVAGQEDLLAEEAAADADAGIDDLVDGPDTRTFAYGQAGARLAVSLGPVDLGAQYLYGYLPAQVINADPASIEDNGGKIAVTYNRYHHAGVDAAAVVAGFATRFELGVNVTDDLEGNDPLVYNPSLGWAAGFDRDLFAGLNVNLQARGTIRLLHDKISGEYDMERDTEPTTTQVALALSQRLFRDAIEWRLAAVMSPEDLDFAIDPSIAIAVGDAELEVFGRIFGGNEEGDLGQFASQSYAGVRLSYVF
jgi:hypothetical protein